MKRMSMILTATTLSTFSLLGYAANPATADQTAPSQIAQEKYRYQNPQTMKPVAKTPLTELTGNFDLTSNYMFRGISQSNNLPAVQGGLTYTFSQPGLYFNVWGSNVNFLDPQGNTATVEFDTIAGITNPIGEHFSYDINIDRYNYPKAASSYNEFIANAAFYFLTAQIGYSSNVYNLHGDGTYYNLGINYDIPSQYIFHLNNVNISGGVGHYSLDSNVGLRSYNDYNIQLSKTISNYVVSLQWTDTNNRSVDARPLRDSHILGTVLANF